ncbi:phage head morphogenesis protein [Helicobacter pullorum]
MLEFDFNQEPKINMEFLKQKIPTTTFNYDELMHEAHLRAFSIAKMMQLDLLKDMQDSLLKAQKEGMSFESWKKDIKPNLAKKGWLGKREVVDKTTGEVKTINVNNRRLKNIYNTNMRSANAQGRAKEQYARKGKVYLRYVAIMDGLTRESHAKLHGTILPREDSFWASNYPPNDWGCRCYVQSLSQAELKTKGFKVSPKAPNFKAHKDWNYDTRNLKGDEGIRQIIEYKAKRYGENSFLTNELKKVQENYQQASKNYKNILGLKNNALEKTTIAKLPQQIMQKLDTKADELLLSHVTLQDHLQKHPEVDIVDYSLLPFLLQDANIYDIKSTKEHHIVLFSRFGKYYRAAIKTTKDKNENYLLSLTKGSKKITK